MTTITIHPFGSIRELFNDAIRLQFPDDQPIKPQDVKDKLITLYANNVIINSCVLSTDDELILEDTIIGHNSNLSILPPVCGG